MPLFARVVPSLLLVIATACASNDEAVLSQSEWYKIKRLSLQRDDIQKRNDYRCSVELMQEVQRLFDCNVPQDVMVADTTAFMRRGNLSGRVMSLNDQITDAIHAATNTVPILERSDRKHKIENELDGRKAENLSQEQETEVEELRKQQKELESEWSEIIQSSNGQGEEEVVLSEKLRGVLRKINCVQAAQFDVDASRASALTSTVCCVVVSLAQLLN